MTDLKQLGKYDIAGMPITGGMGSVYHAIDPVLGRKVAIKILHSHLTKQQGFSERFIREAQILAKLKHNNITQVYEAAESDDGLYLAMEFVEGDTLEDMIFQNKCRDLKSALPIIRQVCDALDYAHKQGVIHRDIKPSNIMIKKSGEVMLMDFGIARLGGSNCLTQDGAALGTPQYMSPEQCKGEQIDYRSDIYSLAIVVYEMLTGTRPFEGENLFSIINKQMANTPPPITVRNAALPRDTAKVIGRALQKDPNRRPQTAMEFYRELAFLIRETSDVTKKRLWVLCVVTVTALISLVAVAFFVMNSGSLSKGSGVEISKSLTNRSKRLQVASSQKKPNVPVVVKNPLADANSYFSNGQFLQAKIAYSQMLESGASEQSLECMEGLAKCNVELALNAENNSDYRLAINHADNALDNCNKALSGTPETHKQAIIECRNRAQRIIDRSKAALKPVARPRIVPPTSSASHGSKSTTSSPEHKALPPPDDASPSNSIPETD